MTRKKRVLDIVLGLIMSVVLLPVLLALALVILVQDGRPVFFASVRVKHPGTSFRLWKFRTMANDANDKGVSGGDKAHRITKTGHFIRRFRLDEIPQLWNIIKGDISFVGPRPPLPEYVNAFPDLYARVLQNRPGVTGLATLVYHRTEERLLAECGSADETEEVYKRRCIPRKANLDLIYAKNCTLCSDFLLMVSTALGRKVRHMKIHPK